MLQMTIKEKLPPNTIRVSLGNRYIAYYDYYAATFSNWYETRKHLIEVVKDKTGEDIRIENEPYHHGNGHFTASFDLVE